MLGKDRKGEQGSGAALLIEMVSFLSALSLLKAGFREGKKKNTQPPPTTTKKRRGEKNA